ncbi:MAG TPA: hypothetical protein VJJ81_01950 [Candidatus Babeliales bacterium]|nr:hypothetical protein [Candidatus Babeliales bacterium]
MKKLFLGLSAVLLMAASDISCNAIIEKAEADALASRHAAEFMLGEWAKADVEQWKKAAEIFLANGDRHQAKENYNLYLKYQVDKIKGEAMLAAADIELASLYTLGHSDAILDGRFE